MTIAPSLNGALFLLLASCAADEGAAARSAEPNQGSVADGGTSAEARLTPSNPKHDWPLTALPVAPSAIILDVSDIADPAKQTFSVALKLGQANKDGSWTETTLGQLTPYPPDRPGRFVFGIDADTAVRLTNRAATLRLRLELQPITTDRPLRDGLVVTLRHPSWQ